jgi:hypothetical protein
MSYPIQALKDELDLVYPTEETFGYAALLDITTVVNLTYTVNFTANQINTAIPHKLVTGTRVRSTASVSQPGIAPSGTLNGATDYFVRVLSATSLQLHSTLNGAVSGSNPIDFTDGGSGTLLINEQTITQEDPMNVLINHEISHPDYARFEIFFSNDAVNINAEGQKQTGIWVIIVNSNSDEMTFGSVLTIQNGSSVTGNNTSGNVHNLNTLAAPITISPGNSKNFVMTFARLN